MASDLDIVNTAFEELKNKLRSNRNILIGFGGTPDMFKKLNESWDNVDRVHEKVKQLLFQDLENTQHDTGK